MWTHATTETMLANSGVPWTALRNGFYADAELRFMGTEWQQGRVAAPADGKVAWTTHTHLAEAAAAVQEPQAPTLDASEHSSESSEGIPF
jgi:NAD(P)H dehydrogenase (quinone)